MTLSSVNESLYSKMPLFVQNATISIYGYYWKRRRFGGIFDQEVEKFKSREVFSSGQWRDYQTIELRKLLIHAFETVPFYKALFKNEGFSLADLNKFELEDLNKLPILTKEVLRQYGTSELLSAKRGKGGKLFSSSGSTGTPTKILLSKSMHQKWTAGLEVRVRSWAGLNHLSKRGMIGGRRIVTEGVSNPPFHRYNFAERQIYFSAYHISSKAAPYYMEAIRNNLDYMTGYAMSNFILARFFEEQNLYYPLKAVITSSEKLTNEMRNIFRKVYGCKTFDSYSGIEDCGLISECEKGGLHVSPDMGIIEFLNSDGRPAKPGQLAEMICTGILNFDQPLIRYRIGDYAVLGDKICPCGRSMPLVSEITGRTEDVVVVRDGREMVRFHSIFIDLPNVLKAQVVQEDFDKFLINVVSLNKLTNNEMIIMKNRMESQLGKIDLRIEVVNDIPMGPNGKFKAVISNVKRIPGI